MIQVFDKSKCTGLRSNSFGSNPTIEGEQKDARSNVGPQSWSDLILGRQEHGTVPDLFREFEDINFRAIRVNENNKENDTEEKSIHEENYEEIQDVSTYRRRVMKPEEQEDLSALFKRSMKIIVIIGQCVGLNPILGILGKGANNMRFENKSWKYLYTLVLFAVQTISTLLYLFIMFKTGASLDTVSRVIFFGTATISTFLLIRIAKRWSVLIQKICNSRLDEYVDSKVGLRCKVATVALLTFSLLEEILQQISIYANILDLKSIPNNGTDSIYHLYLKSTDPWIFELGVADTIFETIAVIIQMCYIVSKITWNYLDVFILCISMYLGSIFNRINEKINAFQKQFNSSSFWKAMREDYTRATRLVRCFDNIISSIIFVSFAKNVYLICLLLCDTLRVLMSDQNTKKTPTISFGSLRRYEFKAFLIYSVVFEMTRFLIVTLVASRIHSAALEPSKTLYEVPTHIYSSEVQRFIEQVDSGMVALSGLQFFYITKHLILTVAGTIVTYELVILQFNVESNEVES